MMKNLPPHQYALVAALAKGAGEPTIENLAALTSIDQALVSAAAVELAQERFIEITELKLTELKLGELGAAIGKGESEMPERLIARAIRNQGGSATIKELNSDSDLQQAGVQPGKFAKNLAAIGWAGFERGTLTLLGDAAADEPPACDQEVAITAVYVGGGSLVTDDKTDARVIAGAEKLKNRKELLAVRERTRRSVSLTAEGARLAEKMAAGEVKELVEANELTPEMLMDGSWREVQFREYDVRLAAERSIPGKTHPLMRVIEQTRLAFLELGFAEASCPMAESAFWDFDALFQPQDHPAREMQDTFYCKSPDKYPLPDDETVARVKSTHEDGWETGSRGWRYRWSHDRAAQVVLRTHMTASSIRAIARNPNPPQKVFSIGKVFRREAVDHKHLPEFYQVDGIIIDEHADFSSLLGTLEVFCHRLGIDEVRFKPDFFPYTEPSAAVEALVGGKWLELAGSGIFRPEVCLPFGCTAPVLAWGFGLERLAMARYGIDSIKDLVQSDFDWLRGARLTG